MKTVLVAGASGYLGRHIVAHYLAAGWHVRALVRNTARARASGLDATAFVEAEATSRSTLAGVMHGADLVISALGITRQRDGLSYQDVDYQANVNLLLEAESEGVPHFAYVHVLNANQMHGVPLADAKQAFVTRLTAAPITSTIICPSGYYSDMADFYAMARSGRVWLFGDGQHKLNPIHGADLAAAIADAICAEQPLLEVGGPQVFTHREIAELAFQVLNKPAKITFLPDVIRRLALRLLPWTTPQHIRGPAQFFLTAMGMDMVGEPTGYNRLTDHFKTLCEKDGALRMRSQSPEGA